MFIVVISILLLAILFYAPLKIAIYGQDYLLVTYSFDFTTQMEDEYIVEIPIPRESWLPVWNITEDIVRLDGNISMSQIVETKPVWNGSGIEEKDLDYLKITGKGNFRVIFQTRNKDVGYFQGVNSTNHMIEIYFETSGTDSSNWFHLVLHKEAISPSGTTDFYENLNMGPPNKIQGCQGTFEHNGWHEVRLNSVWY